MSKPSIPKGTRDFSPEVVTKRTFIFDTVRSVFKKYGYQPIETPTMENLSTLTGKYGEEGDQLIFKIIDSGDYVDNIRIEKDFVFLFLNQQINYLYRKSNLPGEFDNDSAYYARMARILRGIQAHWIESRDFDKLIESLKQVSSSLSNELLSFKDLGLDKNTVTKQISEKALRYDLTVPFARYVVMHQNEITFPFKRYQIQPVWRADRPQRGRYREFYQCDADVVGSESLLNEAEFVLIYDEALSLLGFKDFEVRINNRKILQGIADYCGCSEKLIDLTVAIDKLDKIGRVGVEKELVNKGFSEERIQDVFDCIFIEEEDYVFYTLDQLVEYWKDQGEKDNEKAKLEFSLQDNLSLRNAMGVLYCLLEKFQQAESSVGEKGIQEIIQVLNYAVLLKRDIKTLKIDTTLARGLNYYTGAIFEVKTNEVAMGSIGGGGRYDDLTGMFGLKNLTGVGISFGADRIYDVMEELKLFPENTLATSKVLITCFDEKAFQYALPILQKLRDANISSELYPTTTKMQKQMKYANDKGIPFVIVIGDEEMNTGSLAFKNMQSGEQQKLSIDQIIQQL